MIFGYSVYKTIQYKNEENVQYEQYKQLAGYVDIQRDAAGNVIGSRGAVEKEALQYYDNAIVANQKFKNMLLITGGIILADATLTLLKGAKNRKDYNTKFGITYDLSKKQIETGVVLNLFNDIKRHVR